MTLEMWHSEICNYVAMFIKIMNTKVPCAVMSMVVTVMLMSLGDGMFNTIMMSAGVPSGTV